MSNRHIPYGFQKSRAFTDEQNEFDGPSAVKTIALYLPQYHPIKANDENWGPGFTEWNNVTRGSAEFTEHHQPRVPCDFGYYDLRIDGLQAD